MIHKAERDAERDEVERAVRALAHLVAPRAIATGATHRGLIAAWSPMFPGFDISWNARNLAEDYWVMGWTAKRRP